MFTTPAADLAAAARVLGQAGSFDRWRSRVSGLPESAGEFPVKALAEEIETPGAGQIRAMVTHAGNPVLSLPNGRRLDRLFEGLEFMVSIDIYLNETTRHADVILPPTFGLERDHYALLGHAVAVRNTAHYAPALLDKPDGSRHDWEILAALAERIGRVRGGVEALKGRVRGALGRAIGPRRVLGWILRLGPHRLRLARLERERHGVDLGALEPRLAEILGSRRLHVVPERFRADLPRLERWLEAHSRADGDGLVLISRRGLRSNNSWMHNSERLVAGRERCVLLMHPADASRRGLAHGQRVAIESRVGAVVAALEVSDEVMPGVVSLPHGWGHGRPGTRMRVAAAHPGVSVNDVVDDARVAGLSGTASLSGVPVAVSAAPA
jgi:anaerobic selenocysteine-containing dehydrogenase